MSAYAFKKKSIGTKGSFGAQLKAAREKKKLSLEQAQDATKIRASYLAAIEANNYGGLPVSHRRGFIRRYAAYLEVDYEHLGHDIAVSDTTTKKKDPFSPSMFKRETPWVVTPRLIIGILALVLLVVFVGYVGYQIKRFAAPPALAITKPEKEATTTSDATVLEGRTDPGSLVYVDNFQATVKADGTFSYPIVLRPGLNQISVRSVNTIKKEAATTVSILYQPTPGASPNPSASPSLPPSPNPN